MASSSPPRPSTALGPRDSDSHPGLPGQPGSSATPARSQSSRTEGGRRRKHHGGKKHRRNRRQSFAAQTEDDEMTTGPPAPTIVEERGPSEDRNPTDESRPIYAQGKNGSTTSLDSEALLHDHRSHPPMRYRRPSAATRRPVLSTTSAPTVPPADYHNRSPRRGQHALAYGTTAYSSGVESDGEHDPADDRTPLMSSSRPRSSPSTGYAGFGEAMSHRRRDHSSGTSVSSRRRMPPRQQSQGTEDYDVNNPPSVPGTPSLGATDPMVPDEFSTSDGLRSVGARETLIDIDDIGDTGFDLRSSPPSPRGFDERRRATIAMGAEDDVCFPMEGASELGDEETVHNQENGFRERRRRRRVWPDLSILEEWSREEKEERSGGIRAKKINEPDLIGGRLRPQRSAWHRTEEDEPYRFTYFNEEFQSTIHSQTISELLQPGQTFKTLFVPDPPELSDDSSDDEDELLSPPRMETSHHADPLQRVSSIITQSSRAPTPQPGQPFTHSRTESVSTTNNAVNGDDQSQIGLQQKPKRYGPRPTFWLDVLCPTEAEMRVLSRAFSIHPLTAEDIMMQEAREKVELFRHYYFVNYRTFEQDTNSEDYLEPVNMYVVVFREGVISFHFSMTPHPANVRRRIRQLKDYLILSADWISYAIIDDITDVFGPLIQSIEEEVDEIDDKILQLHSPDDQTSEKPTLSKDTKTKQEPIGNPNATSGERGSDMLRHVGDCRRKVMGLYRLLGNKADVIKGFAKRCNEQWQVAPRSEIGLYLGDIQDHIVTMTGNLTHYEQILSRAHSNYLAQINIRMNERQEQTADVLGKLTVLGTIVLPMNIVTGLWGMNCLVPGQDVEGLGWFFAITSGLFLFGFICYFVAKRVYRIV